MSKIPICRDFSRGGGVKVAQPTLKGGTLANAANSCASCWLAVANAHAVLAMPCSSKSPRRSSATLANAANTYA